MRTNEKKRLELTRLIGKAEGAFEIIRKSVADDCLELNCAINMAETAVTAMYHSAFSILTPPGTTGSDVVKRRPTAGGQSDCQRNSKATTPPVVPATKITKGEKK